MIRSRLCISAVVAVIVFPAAMSFGAGNPQEGLDKMIKVQMTRTSIRDVFDKLTEESGVEFEIPQETYNCLPYGKKTLLTMTIPGLSLRKALDSVLLPQALQWVTVGKRVRIIPTEPLMRIGRRATFEELKVLGALLSKEMKTVPETGKESVAIRKLTGNNNLNIILPEGVLPNVVSEMFKRAGLYLPCPAVEWLDGLCGRKRTWYLDGHRIMIVDRVYQVRRQLGRRISMEYKKAPLRDVLLDLAEKGRVQISFDPGVLSRVPLNQSNFSLVMEDKAISQVLEVVVGETGLALGITDEGIHVGSPGKKATGTAAVPGDPGFFIQTSFKTSTGREIRVFLRPDEVPDSLRRSIEAEKLRMIRELEKHLPAAKDDEDHE